jgi:hypothetical protein
VIYHFYTAYSPVDPDTIRRTALAQASWKLQPWTEIPIRDEDLPRMFQEKGRSFPYLQDVFNKACEGRDDNDIMVYTNADIHVKSTACGIITEALQAVDAVYGYRRDFHHRLETPVADADYVKGNAYPGSDIYAFRVFWWNTVKDQMPNMILGGEGWDPLMRVLIDTINLPGDKVLRDLICHERHGGVNHWEHPVNRYKSGWNLHNLTLAKKFCAMRGINPASFGFR